MFDLFSCEWENFRKVVLRDREKEFFWQNATNLNKQDNFLFPSADFGEQERLLADSQHHSRWASLEKRQKLIPAQPWAGGLWSALATVRGQIPACKPGGNTAIPTFLWFLLITPGRSSEGVSVFGLTALRRREAERRRLVPPCASPNPRRTLCESKPRSGWGARRAGALPPRLRSRGLGGQRVSLPGWPSWR